MEERTDTTLNVFLSHFPTPVDHMGECGVDDCGDLGIITIMISEGENDPDEDVTVFHCCLEHMDGPLISAMLAYKKFMREIYEP